MKTDKVTIRIGLIDLLLVSILFFLACGNAGPDHIQISPQEISLGVGEGLQFQARAFTKDNKVIPDAVFEWQIQGEAGSINDSGRFHAEQPGEVIILAKSGSVTGTAKILVQPSQDIEISEIKVEQPSTSMIDIRDIIVIDNQAFEERNKGAVNLSHRKHIKEYGVTCIECHHEYQDGKNIWTENDPVKRCVTCHDPIETKDNVMKLQIAYHTNCKECHKEVVKQDENKNAPYIKCADCHEDME
ncbi:MAG: cytochrome c3 family protein [Deltaproteobacteria bacterium]|nr:cytochrome c3 family protein [Deltaproteobacteria bacterium]